MQILHLEDDPNDRELIHATLRAAGIDLEIVHACTRQEFLSALDKERLALILSDFAIPGFDGVSALEAARERHPNVPFIFVSGTLGEESAIESLHRGATDYVLKQRLTRLGPAALRALREAENRRNQVRASEAAADHQQFIKAMLESLDAGIIACDAAGAITVLNRAAREILGVSGPAVLTEPWVEHYSLYDPQMERFLEPGDHPLFRALRGERVLTVEVLVQPKGGAARTVLVTGQAISGLRGQGLGAVIALHDITDRKSLEEQLRQSHKLEAIGSLAGGIAHDFNNLLTVIGGYSELLLESLEPEGTLHANALEIRKAGDRAAELTRQLLAFSRRQVLEPRILDLNEVLAEMERMLRRLLPSNIELATLPCEGLGQVSADPGQIEQVVLNLVVNARDAMPDGGRISLATSNEVLDDTARDSRIDADPGPYVVLSVSDTGCGMPPDVRARIFEPFFTTKEVGLGTGLGLSTVYGIVKQTGGTVWVYSEPELGSTFKIFLPRVDGSPAVRQAEPGGAELPHGTETILLAEDDATVRTLARAVLESIGYTVLESAEGEAALEICRERRGEIHLVLTDLMMPGMSGVELVKRIRQLAPGCRALYMSGYAADLLPPTGGPSESVVFYLQKPFGRELLARRVREALDAPAENPKAR